MSTVEYVCLFVRAAGDRLRAAERLVLALPQLMNGALEQVELRYQSQASLLGVYVRLRGDGLSQRACDRLVFWTARAGGRAMALDGLTPGDRARIAAYLENPTQALPPVAPAALFEASGQFFTRLGAPPDRRRSASERPVLVMDVGGPGWEGVRWSPAEGRLFVAAPLAPAAGDEVPLLVRIPGATRPLQARARIVEVRAQAAAGPGSPAGYTLQLENPPAPLVEALAGAAPDAHGDSRAAPRFSVNAPVKVTRSADLQLEDEAERPAAPPATAPAAHALIEYATDQELAADYLENLSQGGAYVRTASPAPLGSPVELQLRLPNGAELRARATVAFVRDGGMGVRFELDAEAEAQLAAAMAHISARPRRALVVDDDDLVRRIIADALRERGFEVLTAANASEGWSVLSEELLALDLLVTDVVMPGLGGEEFVRRIRKSGGEADLAIVCVSGQLGDGGVEARLEQVGADAVLDKALGPDLIAQAADAVLERKRLVAQA
jgi:uncharacterized protein (TIGR02266 family)